MEIIVNYYRILGVSSDATFDEIKKAYRNKVKKFHPDKEHGNEEYFKRLKEAYETLKIAEKRKQYDDQLLSRKPNHPKKAGSPAAAVINIRRKNPKKNTFSSLTLNAAVILIGITGRAYLNKRKRT